MAENKKSFVLYTDNKSIIDLMTDEQAGILLKTLFAYVNDEDPIIDKSIILVFEMFKLQLKRDLKKWEQTKEGRSAAGKASAEARRLAKLNELNSTNSTNVDFVQQNLTNSTVNDSVNVSVSDSVSVSVNENENILKKDIITASPKFSFLGALLNYGFDRNLVEDWLKVRKTKKATNTETAFNKFIDEIEKRDCNINEILEVCVVKNWSGFQWSWYDNLKQQSNTYSNGQQIKTNQQIFAEAMDSEIGRNFKFK